MKEDTFKTTIPATAIALQRKTQRQTEFGSSTVAASVLHSETKVPRCEE